MAQKSSTYYTVRSSIRGLVKVLILLVAYVIIHLATYSIWTVLLFAAVVTCGFVIHDNLNRTAATESA